MAEFTEVESGHRNDRPELHRALEAVHGRVRAMLLADFLGGEGEEVTVSPVAGTA